jgi:flagellar export protein FliJ
MKSFRFTLEPVLIIRERQEREAEERYGRALAAQRKALAALRDTELELDDAFAEHRRRLVEGSPVVILMQQQLYCAHIEATRKTAANAADAAEQKVKEAVLAMVAAKQQRDIIEKFRANQQADYDRQLSAEEQKMLDELAGRRIDPALSWRNSDHD